MHSENVAEVDWAEVVALIHNSVLHQCLECSKCTAIAACIDEVQGVA